MRKFFNNSPRLIFLCVLATACGLDAANGPGADPSESLPGIGEIVDWRGCAHSRSGAAGRWRPIHGRRALSPGCWVRTGDDYGDLARIALGSGTQAILGPGTLVHIPGSGDLVLANGEMQILPAMDSPPTLWGGAAQGGGRILCTRPLLLSTNGERLAASQKKPDWLKNHLAGQDFAPPPAEEPHWEDVAADIRLACAVRNGTGYFAARIGTPSTDADPRPADRPVNLIVLADTSASMDADQRARQTDFLRILLSSLQANDRFALAAVDVDTVWLTDGMSEMEHPEIVSALLASLAARPSLGWTDLPQAVRSSHQLARNTLAATTPIPGSPSSLDYREVCHIVYVGDAMPVAATGDAAGTALDIALIWNMPGETPPSAIPPRIVGHVVHPDETGNRAVARAIAGHLGTVSTISGNLPPAAVADALLAAMTEGSAVFAAVEGEKIDMSGLIVGDCPESGSGSRRVLLGRFDPASVTRRSALALSWMTPEGPITRKVPIRLSKPPPENPSVPLMWAWSRRRDLLDKTATPEIEQEIAALAAEFNPPQSVPPAAAETPVPLSPHTAQKPSAFFAEFFARRGTEKASPSSLANAPPALQPAAPPDYNCRLPMNLAEFQTYLARQADDIASWPVQARQRDSAAPAPAGWNRESADLAASLIRNITDALEQQTILLVFEKSQPADIRAGTVRWEALLDKGNWLVSRTSPGMLTRTTWRKDEESGLLDPVGGLAFRHRFAPNSRAFPDIPLPNGFLLPWLGLPQDAAGGVRTAGATRKTLVFGTATGLPLAELDIDTAANAVVARRAYQDGRLAREVVFADPVEIGGITWFQTALERDGGGKALSEYRLRVQPVEAPAALAAWRQAEEVFRDFLPIDLPVPAYHRAASMAMRGAQTHASRFALFLDTLPPANSFPGWPEVRAAAAWENLHAGGNPKRKLRWADLLIQQNVRDHDEVRTLFAEFAQRIAGDNSFSVGGLVAPVAATENIPSPGGDAECLAEGLLNLAGGSLGKAETVELLKTLKAVYTALPRPRRGEQRWGGNMAKALRDCGRDDEALLLAEEIARKLPWDAEVYAEYANAMARAGKLEDAVAWLERGIATPEKFWESGGRKGISDSYVHLLEKHGTPDMLLPVLAARLAENPDSADDYGRLLRAMARGQRRDEARAIAGQWLRLARNPATADIAKITAALQSVVGAEPIFPAADDDSWLSPLAECVAAAFTRPELAAAMPETFRPQGWLAASPEIQAAIARGAAALCENLPNFEVAHLERMLSWTGPRPPAIDRRLAAALESEWRRAMGDPHRQLAVEKLALGIWRGLDGGQTLRFALECGSSSGTVPADRIRRLAELIPEAPWSADLQNRLLGVVLQLAPENRGRGEGAWCADILSAIVRWSLERRTAESFAAVWREAEDDSGVERLDIRNRIREKCLDESRLDLARELAQVCRDNPATTALPWLRAEHLRLLADLHESRAAAAAPAGFSALAASPEELVRSALDLLGSAAPQEFAGKADRRLFDHTFAAARSLALASPENGAAPLLAYMLASLAQAAEPAGREPWRSITRTEWQNRIVDFLKRLKRHTGLEKLLAEWLVQETSPGPATFHLATLFAATDRLGEAIAIMEKAKKEGLLNAGQAYRLAGWHRQAEDPAAAREALDLAWRLTDTAALATLMGKLDWPPVPIFPDEVGASEEFLAAIPHLISRLPEPEPALHLAVETYMDTLNPRIPAQIAAGFLSLPDDRMFPCLAAWARLLAPVAQSPAGEPFFSIIAGLDRTPLTENQRLALDLFTPLVLCQGDDATPAVAPDTLAAVETVLDKLAASGPHQPRPEHIASLFSMLGRMLPPEMRDAHLGRFRKQLQRPQAGSREQLMVTGQYAGLLWDYGRRQAAAEILTRELADYQAAHTTIGQPDLAILRQTLDYLTALRQSAWAEQILTGNLNRCRDPGSRLEIERLLHQLYAAAIAAGEHTSLGEGDSLYRAANRGIQEKLMHAGDQDALSLLHAQAAVFHAAATAGSNAVQADVRSFAVEVAPHCLRRLEPGDRHAGAARFIAASIVHPRLGARDAIAFVLATMQTATAHYRIMDGSRHIWNDIARWRLEAGDLGPLETTLQELAGNALARELRNGSGMIPEMCKAKSHLFWHDKAASFQKTAEQCHQARRDWRGRNTAACDYLHDHLGKVDRSLELLTEMERDGLLDTQAQRLLAERLNHQKRYADVLALFLKEPVAETPGHLRHPLLVACTRQGRDQAAAALLDLMRRGIEDNPAASADEYLALATWSHDAGLVESARKSAETAIGAFHMTGIHGREYQHLTAWRILATAAAAQGDAAAAIATARGLAAAATAWNNSQDQVAVEIQPMLSAVAALGTFADDLAVHCRRTGDYFQPLHLALAQSLNRQGNPAAARRQYELVADRNPGDLEMRRRLIDISDQLHDTAAAIGHSRKLLHANPRNPQAHLDLLQRTKAAGEDPATIERTLTAAVELMPDNPGAHRLLAAAREEQRRWPDAIAHWRRVTQLDYDDPEAMISLAKAHKSAGNREQAMATVGRILARNWPPEHGDVHHRALKLIRE